MVILKTTALSLLIALGTWAQAGDLTQSKKTLTLEGAKQVLAAAISEAKRLNSPNDLVYKSDGAVYFTDPPFGLPKFFEDPRKRIAV